MRRFRTWLANYLVAVARRIDPENEAVMSFWVQRFTDLAITGQSSIKISIVDPIESEKLKQ